MRLFQANETSAHHCIVQMYRPANKKYKTHFRPSAQTQAQSLNSEL